ncbi:MAG: hypothetical protein AAGA66_02020 [Bacteroidota bacterium]
MQDNLKDYVRSDPESFESYSFDVESGWEQVAEKIVPDNKRNFWAFGIAAGFTILLLTSFLVWSTTKTNVPNEIAEMEGYYQEEINHKISLVKNQLEDDQVLADFAHMDQAFAELKADLDENVDNEEVVIALMDNYRLKLKILEEILEELDKEKSETSN